MALKAPKVRISTLTEPILPGRGFYQLEEDSLFVQIGPFSKKRRFFSYLESENVRFDIDREGRLIFIEVVVARRHWKIEPGIFPPTIVEVADIRWLNFRAKVGNPILVSEGNRAVLLLKFSNAKLLRNYYLAESVVAQVDENNKLAAIWITDIGDDRAGQKIAAFRKKMRGKPEPFS